MAQGVSGCFALTSKQIYLTAEERMECRENKTKYFVYFVWQLNRRSGAETLKTEKVPVVMVINDPAKPGPLGTKTY